MKAARESKVYLKSELSMSLGRGEERPGLLDPKKMHRLILI